MNPDSLTEYVQHQADLLARMAQQAETLGFCVITHGVNPHTHNTRLYNFMAGGFGDMFDTWCRSHGRKYIRVNLWFTNPLPADGPITGNICLWKFQVPRTRRLRPIIVALDFVCSVYAGRVTNYQRQLLLNQNKRPLSFYKAGVHEYTGVDRASFELVLGVLCMEPHRKILTDRYAPKDPLRT